MFSLDGGLRYWLYSEPTDMRKSFHTLSGVVRNKIGGDPMNGVTSTLPFHRHQKTVVCLRGRLVWEFYDELERICTERIELSPNGPVVALNIPAGQWHTAKALESGTVILEMKASPYEPIGPEDILGV